jgi:hypothetical protein
VARVMTSGKVKTLKILSEMTTMDNPQPTSKSKDMRAVHRLDVGGLIKISLRYSRTLTER